jgi:hypothetical protein
MKKVRLRPLSAWAMVVGMFLAVPSFSWAQGQSNAVVVRATRHAFAPPLSQLVPMPPRASSDSGEEEGLSVHAQSATRLVEDSVLQASPETISSSGLSALSTTPGQNILGMGSGFPGYSEQAVVPDTNGAAGPTQFVQWVNESFVVFNKSTGTVAYGPANGNTLWQALGGSCAASDNLDPIAQFDKLANRWVMMMPVFAAPGYLCVAVSTTSDAINGGWNLYAFELPAISQCRCRFGSDYPKWGVWPDGYYVSYNQANNLNFMGAAACVVDRNSMLNGAAAATMQCFTNTSTSFGALLPADVDGTTPPPINSPEYFLNFDYTNEQSLDLWQFHVDWTTPTNSTFTGPTNIPVAAFTEACGETALLLNNTTGACIPQASTSQMLDSMADRVMYRLAYRNFPDHQSLLVNHTVSTGTSTSQTGIRWYELQNTQGTFGLYQQGTYAPDSNYRWMGSIAMDQSGDIALGYSVSSSTMSPSIGYTGRVPSDPLGQMESEIDVLASASVPHGSQTNTFRWGDYSSMMIDPADDCTFWYTTEYQSTLGNRWSTRIASFKFPSCATTQNYTLTVNEAGQGTVTSTDGKINCTNGSGACSAVYLSGSSVTMNATAASGWALSGWSGGCSGGNPCTVVMNGNLSATATFTAQNYTLTVNEVGQGTVTSTDGQINCTNGSGTCSAVYSIGSSVTMNATAGSGWTFSGWSGVCTGGNPCTVVMNSNLSPTATFTAIPSWAVVNKTSNAGNPIKNLTIPATGAGHLIAVAMMFNGSTSVASVSDNATGGSNTYVSAGARATVGAGSAEIWYAVNSNSGATVVTPTFAGSPTRVQITVWEVSGVSTLRPDVTNISSGNVVLNDTPGPAVTTTQVGDFVVSVLYANSAAFSRISTGNEFTDDFKTNGDGWAHITSNSSSAGTHQASWFTAAPAGKYCASTVAFFSAQ